MRRFQILLQENKHNYHSANYHDYIRRNYSPTVNFIKKIGNFFKICNNFTTCNLVCSYLKSTVLKYRETIFRKNVVNINR